MKKDTDQMTEKKELRRRYERAEEYPSRRFTPRDGRIINWVYRMRFLSRKQIQRLEFKPNQARYCRARLRWLYDEGYLDRRRMDLRTGFGANMPIYCLDEKGADWIALNQKMGRSEVDWKPRDNRVKIYFMEHTLAINDFWIDIVLATRESEHELVRWIDERTLKSDEMKDYVEDPSGSGRISIIPDGYFCLGLPDGRRACFALELDRGTVTRDRWKTKIRGYVEYTKSGRYEKRYGTPSLRVLTAVAAARRAGTREEEERKIRRRVEKIKKWTEDEGGKRIFWFAGEADLGPETVLTDPVWQMAGQEGQYRLLE